MGDRRHLAMPAQRQHEVGPHRREHLAVVGEGRRAAHLGGAPRDDRGIGILDRDQLHVRHGDEVAQIGGVVERVPMAHFHGGDANCHGEFL